MTRALLIESRAPKSFWLEALATSVYLINQLPTYILNFKIPLDIPSTFFDIPSSLSLDPKIFGCTVFVHIPKHDRTKLSPCAIKCVFVGYGVNQKGYRCYDPETRRIHTTMNCDLVESEYFYHHLGGQGENNNSDPPSYPTPTPTSNPEPIPEPSPDPMPSHEVEVGPTESPSYPHEQSQMFSDSPDLSSPLLNPEVSSSNSPVDMTNNVRQEEEGARSEGETSREDSSEIMVDQDTGQYAPEYKGRTT